MRVSLIDRCGVLSTQLWQRVEQRLFSKFLELEPRPRRLSLVVAIPNADCGSGTGGTGNAEHWCRLAISPRRAGDVVVTKCYRDAFACIANAIDHAFELSVENLEESRCRAPKKVQWRRCQDRRGSKSVSGPIERAGGTPWTPVVSDATIGGP